MDKNNDVIIVGAGVIGCSIAYHLAKHGITSQIIERESIGARSSGKAWGLIGHPSMWFLAEKEDPEHSLLSMPVGDTVANWIELYTQTYMRIGDISYDLKEKGGIDIELGRNYFNLLAFDDETEHWIKGEISALNDIGHKEMCWVDTKDLINDFPELNPEVRGAGRVTVYQLEPYKYTLGYAQAAEKMGCKVKQGEVIGFGTNGGKITSVKLASGKTIEADAVVIAMGPWTGKGTSWLGKELPIQIVLESCLMMETPQALPLNAITDGVNAIVPKVNGEVIVGSAGGPHLRQDHFDTRLSEDHKLELLEGAIRMWPPIENAKLVEYRGDLQAWNPGPSFMKPVMGRIPEYDNAFVASRFATLGISQSAGAGNIMADLIADGNVPPGTEKMMEQIDPAKG